MIKKYLLVGALVAPFTFVDKVNAFEFPDKPPFGELSANVSYNTNYYFEVTAYNFYLLLFSNKV